MMVEQAAPDRRGFVGSFQQLGFGLGILAGTLSAFVSTWLVGATGDLIAPTYYAMGCGVITVVTAACFVLAGGLRGAAAMAPGHV